VEVVLLICCMCMLCSASMKTKRSTSMHGREREGEVQYMCEGKERKFFT